MSKKRRISSLRKKTLRKINLILASSITALGVVGCSHQKNIVKQGNKTTDDLKTTDIEVASEIREQPVVCMYGVPRAKYVISGSVENENGDALVGKEITVKSAGQTIHASTDENGHFDLVFDGFPTQEITFEIDGQSYTENVIYDTDPVDAWDRGTSTMQVRLVHPTNNIQIDDKIERAPEIMVKYGVPPIRQIK